MCELFCFNSNESLELNEYLKSFYSHSEQHPHGWGLAYEKDDEMIIDKEAVKAVSSFHLKNILATPIISKTAFAHIRLATTGRIEMCNCHPFAKKDNSGRVWIMMHNGTVFDFPELDKYADTEEGDTDSERILLYIIDKINDFESNKNSPASVEERFELLAAIVEELSQNNKINLMIFDGEIIYVHTNMRESLFFLQTDDYFLSVSSPLNNESFKEMEINKLFAIKNGKILFESEAHNHEFVFTKDHEEYLAEYLDSLRGDELNLDILSKVSADEVLEGLFGLEWEALRVKENGKLSLTPHPSIFGDKLKNPYVTTDFSESQIELITPTFASVEEAFEAFSILSDIVNSSLSQDEYLWFNSIPAILPSNSKIPIAKYSDEDEHSQIYRENLAKKYGFKKQMISGVHFNFSFTDDFIEKLHDVSNSELPFRIFKDELYLKISRNYLRYCWMIIYLTGCSLAAHESFSDEFIHLMDASDNHGGYYSTHGPSFRNGSGGYKNLKRLYPSYKSVFQFVFDINSFIESGDLSEAKELYTQIRLKPKNPKNVLDSLMKDGIQYVEVRTLDINPFYKCGVVENDMKFLQLFLIYMLIKHESDYENWLKEAFINEELVAERAYDDSIRLLKDGCEIEFKKWAFELLDEMYEMCEVMGIEENDTLNLMYERISDSNLTYAKYLLESIKENGYIGALMNLSILNKQNSIDFMKNIDKETRDEYLSIVLYEKA